ncbi:hypothetical protein ALI144C_09270 [Actinosynnema sp. ALI-1.44]|uniref:DUF11 domain-containing protein n=1 Tax=Actinosynnema sp. ALI-1.44 TaxID=1933779 RepID=UPI00097C5139|nr:DUF11 domain-containing protein [Actinosynnema sp. ALI-1.44]ONI87562.1 hypothetical protein ALI144C_09270 [Actinosynnema sp. ALI-1.44]
MLTTAALLAATLLGAAATAPLPVAADISVDLAVTSTTYLLPGANFELSITNQGPEPLTSATVVVRFGADGGPTFPTPCAFDSAADTLTCPFGALPVGGTAKISFTAYFAIGGPPMHFTNTATRTASTPLDPDSANDSDSVRCDYIGSGGFPPPAVRTLYC